MPSTPHLRSNSALKLHRFALIGLSAAIALGIAACKSNPSAAPIAIAVPAGPDPAAVNLAPVDQNYAQQSQSYPQSQGYPQRQGTRVLGVNRSYRPQQQGEGYYDDTNDGSNGNYGSDAADQPPPALRSYQQPPAPGEGYIWTPGYWGHNPDGYIWVQGSWARPPYQGALYTPGYWHNDGRRYTWHHPHWGQHVGFYGGINYGYGYIGTGYYGGYWNNDHFYYNRAVNNLPNGFINVYQRPVVYGNVAYDPGLVGAFSFNGPGGVDLSPRDFELAAYREDRVIVNHGHPYGFIPGNPNYIPQRSYDEHFGQHFEKHDNGRHKGRGHDDFEDGDEGYGNGKGHGEGHGDEHGNGHGEGHGKH